MTNSYISNNSFTDIDLESGDLPPQPRAEKTSGRRNITKLILAVAGVAGVAAIGAVTSSGPIYDQRTGYRAASASRRLEAPAVAEPTAIDSLIGMGISTPAYLSVDGWEKCVAEEPMGTSNQYCIPKIKPSACIEKSWGSLAADIIEISVCSTAKPSNNPKAQTEKAEASDKYKLGMDTYLSAHRAEIEKFIADNKDAVADIQPEIENAIKDETFDFAHYKEQLQELVNEHDMKDYKDKFEEFTYKHKQAINDFIKENESAVSDVKDRITTEIKTGNFDFKHYQDVIQEYVDEFDMNKYKKDMDNFVSTHQKAIQKFVDDNKDAVNDVADQITELINSGSFDFVNYKQEIQDLVSEYDFNNLAQNGAADKLASKFSTVQNTAPGKLSAVQDSASDKATLVTGNLPSLFN
jgi:CRISPR/Cas system-associated exonuclease Cas4 (RecB family)